MVRQLPVDPTKRRLQIFKRLYQHLEHFHSLQETGRMEFDSVITLDTGEDVYLPDLLVGLGTLPRRQREAFSLICLQGYTETAARDLMLPNSKSSTPIQQYADSGLVRMVEAYDAKQRGDWPPSPKRRSLIMTVLHPLVRQGLEATRKKIVSEIEGLQQALAQVDAMLSPPAAAPAPPPPATSAPSPTPRPEGKPTLADAAKELAATGS